MFSGWTVGAIAFWGWILRWPTHHCIASDYFDACTKYADGIQPWAVFSFFLVLTVYLFVLGVALWIDSEPK